MSQAWPEVELGRFLRRRKDEIDVQDSELYMRLTIRLYGKGVEPRDVVAGTEIGTKRQFVTRAGQLILSKIDARNGAFGIVPTACDKAIITGNFWVFDVDNESLDSRFLEYLTKTHLFVDYCNRASDGTTNRLYLQEPKFLAQKIKLPPLTEQRRIVARIEQLAAKIDLARGLRSEAAEEAERLLARAVSGLRLKETEWKSVQTAVLGRKGSVRSGPFGSQLHHEEFVSSGIAAIGTRDVQANRFSLTSGWFVTPEKFAGLRRYQVFPGDILATIVGASIGRFCVVPDDVPVAFTTKHVQALTLDTHVGEPRFVSYMLNYHERCRHAIFSQTEGSAQPSLNAAKVLAISLPLPPLPDQHRIVAYLDDLQAKVDALKRLQAQSAAELDALLPSILDKAFKGEL